MSEKLTDLTKVTSLGSNSLLYAVDPDRAVNDKSVSIAPDDLIEVDRSNTTQLGYKYIPADFDFTSIPASYSNSIWEIRYSHDLNGGTITMPENVTLFFNGGSFDDFTLVGDKTTIKADAYEIFKGAITLSGDLYAETSYLEWVGCIADAYTQTVTKTWNTISWDIEEWTGTDNTSNISKMIKLFENIKGNVVVDKGIYHFDKDSSPQFFTNGVKNKNVSGGGGFTNLYTIHYDAEHVTYDNINFYGRSKPFDLPFTLTSIEADKNVVGKMWDEDFWNNFFATTGLRFDTDDINKGSRNCIATNCYAENRSTGFASSVSSSKIGYQNYNISFINCKVDFMYNHGIGCRYTIGLLVDGLIADRIFVGMPHDSSSGCVNSITVNGIYTNCRRAWKAESSGADVDGEWGRSDTAIYSNNIYRDWEVNPYGTEEVSYALTANGRGVMRISGNHFEIHRNYDTTFSLTASRNIFQNNTVKYMNDVDRIFITATNLGIGHDTEVSDNVFDGFEVLGTFFTGNGKFINNRVNMVVNSFYINNVETIYNVGNYYKSLAKIATYGSGATAPLIFRNNYIADSPNSGFDNLIISNAAGNRDFIITNNHFENCDKPYLFNILANNLNVQHLTIKNNVIKNTGAILYATSSASGTNQGTLGYDIEGNHIEFIEKSGQASYVIRTFDVRYDERRTFTNNNITNKSSLTLLVTAMVSNGNTWNGNITTTIQTGTATYNKD